LNNLIIEKLLIRGLTFRGSTLGEIRQQVEEHKELLRKQLLNEISSAVHMQSGSGMNGKWNTGMIMMNKTRKSLEVCESFLSENTYQ